MARHRTWSWIESRLDDDRRAIQDDRHGRTRERNPRARARAGHLARPAWTEQRARRTRIPCIHMEAGRYDRVGFVGRNVSDRSDGARDARVLDGALQATAR